MVWLRWRASTARFSTRRWVDKRCFDSEETDLRVRVEVEGTTAWPNRPLLHNRNEHVTTPRRAFYFMTRHRVRRAPILWKDTKCVISFALQRRFYNCCSILENEGEWCRIEAMGSTRENGLILAPSLKDIITISMALHRRSMWHHMLWKCRLIEMRGKSIGANFWTTTVSLWSRCPA